MTQVVVSGSVTSTALPFVHRSDRLQATVETVALVYDEAGAIAATLETERTTLDLTDADYALLRRRGVPYRRTVPLKPGRYQVRLAVREDATGLLGSAWGKVEIPDLAAGRLTLSSLFLLKDDGDVRGAGRPDAAPTLHSVQDRPRFGRARACTCSSTRTTRSATRRARSTSSRRRRSCGRARSSPPPRRSR